MKTPCGGITMQTTRFVTYLGNIGPAYANVLSLRTNGLPSCTIYAKRTYDCSLMHMLKCLFSETHENNLIHRISENLHKPLVVQV